MTLNPKFKHFMALCRTKLFLVSAYLRTKHI